MDFNFDTGTIFNGIQTLDPTVLPPLGGLAGVLTISGSGAVLMPGGATGSRPSGLAGMLRYNSNFTDMEYFNGTVWVQLSTGGGTVTSITVTTGTGMSVSTGSTQTITSTGTFALTLNAELQGLSAISGTGVIVNTAPGVYTSRTILGTAGDIVVTNGDGIAGNPTIDLAAITQGSTGNFVKITLDGFGRVTGNTAVTTADITNLVDATYVNVTGDTMSGNLTFTGSAIVTGLPSPVNGSDAANKSYVDSSIAGIFVHTAVTVYSGTDLASTYTSGTIDMNGGYGIGATLTDSTSGTVLIIDSIPVRINDTILVNGQIDNRQNGLYSVTTLGVAGVTPWVLTRETSWNDSVLNQAVPGTFTYVQQGTQYATSGWLETDLGTGGPGQAHAWPGGSDNALVFGSDNILFTQFSGAGTYSAGPGLTLAGTQFSLISPVSTVLGGTGTNSAPTAGQILIGDTGGTFSPALIGSGTGINVASSSGAITISNTGVTSIAGTSNQITASTSTGAVTLSLPSAVSTGSLTLTGTTPNSFLYSGSGGLLTTTSAPTNGQILIGSTGGAPVAATISAGTGISVTNGAGTITIGNTGVTSVDVSGGSTGLTFSGGPITTTGTITMSGTLNPVNGGLGISAAPTAGQILVGTTAGVYTPTTLTAGTGIGVTSTSGSVTINNTGVTSVSLADGSTTPIYTITGSPVTSTGTLTFTLASQAANTVFAAPNGSSGQPSFRTLTYADMALKLYVENPSSPVAPVASGANSVAIGSGATASGTGSFANGAGSNASIWGGKAFANGSFATAGDAQHGVYVLRTVTTNTTVTEMCLDGTGGSQVLILPNNSVFTFTIIVAARRTDATGGGAAYKFEGAVRKDTTSGSVTFIGTPSKTILGETNTPWDATIIADVTNGSLNVLATGETGKTIRWVASVLTTEVTN